LPDPIARRGELPVVQGFVAGRSAFRGLKDQILWSWQADVSDLALSILSQQSAQRKWLCKTTSTIGNDVKAGAIAA